MLTVRWKRPLRVGPLRGLGKTGRYEAGPGEADEAKVLRWRLPLMEAAGAVRVVLSMPSPKALGPGVLLIPAPASAWRAASENAGLFAWVERVVGSVAGAKAAPLLLLAAPLAGRPRMLYFGAAGYGLSCSRDPGMAPQRSQRPATPAEAVAKGKFVGLCSPLTLGLLSAPPLRAPNPFKICFNHGWSSCAPAQRMCCPWLVLPTRPQTPVVPPILHPLHRLATRCTSANPSPRPPLPPPTPPTPRARQGRRRAVDVGLPRAGAGCAGSGAAYSLGRLYRLHWQQGQWRRGWRACGGGTCLYRASHRPLWRHLVLHCRVVRLHLPRRECTALPRLAAPLPHPVSECSPPSPPPVFVPCRLRRQRLWSAQRTFIRTSTCRLPRFSSATTSRVSAPLELSAGSFPPTPHPCSPMPPLQTMARPPRSSPHISASLRAGSAARSAAPSILLLPLNSTVPSWSTLSAVCSSAMFSPPDAQSRLLTPQPPSLPSPLSLLPPIHLDAIEALGVEVILVYTAILLKKRVAVFCPDAVRLASFCM